MTFFCKVLQKLLSQRIKQLSTDEIQEAAADEPLKVVGNQENEENEKSENSESDEETEEELKDLGDQVEFLSNKYVTIEKMY